MQNVLVRLALLVLLLPATALADKQVLGWVEKVRIYPGNLILKAKIDTGARTSSLHCDCSKVVKRNGEKWLRFTVTDSRGKSREFEKKILRTVKIKRHFGRSQKRHVILIDICLAGVRKTIQASVIDRSGFNYQMLIGRRAMAGQFLVDPGHSLQTRPVCR